METSSISESSSEGSINKLSDRRFVKVDGTVFEEVVGKGLILLGTSAQPEQYQIEPGQKYTILSPSRKQEGLPRYILITYDLDCVDTYLHIDHNELLKIFDATQKRKNQLGIPGKVRAKALLSITRQTQKRATDTLEDEARLLMTSLSVLPRQRVYWVLSIR